MWSLSRLPCFVAWDSSFIRTCFEMDSTLYQAPWSAGSVPQPLLHLPNGFVICAMWRDSSAAAGWWISASKLFLQTPGTNHYALGLWHAVPGDSAPRAVEVDTSTTCDAGCACPPRWIGRIDRSRGPILLNDLMTGMAYSPDPSRAVTRASHGSVAAAVSAGLRAEDLPLRSLRRRALRIRTSRGGGAPGDTSEHAVAPLVLLNAVSRKSQLLYPEGSPCGEEGFDRLGFAERNGYLLVGQELSGECAWVVDLRSGNPRFKLPENSTHAAWVRAPSRPPADR